MTDAKCVQTGTSSSANSNGTVVGTCKMSKAASTFSLLQQYQLTLTAQVGTPSRTVTSYTSSRQVGGDTYYRTGPNLTGGSYANGTVVPAHGWSDLFFAAPPFANRQQESLNRTTARGVDASPPGLPAATTRGKL